MTKPLLALVMIVKDEAASMRAVLRACEGVVDRATILDTGSRDGTQDIVREFPWARLYEEPFVAFDKITDRRVINFAATRNRALELAAQEAEPAVFTLMLSGDETLENGAELRKFLESKRDAADDAYSVTMRRGTKSWKYPRVLRTGAGRKYMFPIHETPVGKDGQTVAELVPGVSVLYAPADEARLMRRMREVDLPVLTALADAEPVTHEDHVSRARALVYLAQTHENLAIEFDRDDPGKPWLSHMMAAMAFYWRRADLGGDEDEKNFALFHYFDVVSKIGFIYTHEELVERLEMLADMDPRRPEVRYKLAFHQSQVPPVDEKDKRPIQRAQFFAREGVRVAREAKVNPPTFSTDARCEWLCLQIAAEAAQKLGYAHMARQAAQEGLAAGGPNEAFKEFLS